MKPKFLAVLRAALWGSVLSLVVPALAAACNWIGVHPLWLYGISVLEMAPEVYLQEALGLRGSVLASYVITVLLWAIPFALIAAIWQFGVKRAEEHRRFDARGREPKMQERKELV